MFSKVICLVLFLSPYFVRAAENCAFFTAFELKKNDSGVLVITSGCACSIDIRGSEFDDALSKPRPDLIKLVKDNIKKFLVWRGEVDKDVKIYGYEGYVLPASGVGGKPAYNFSGGNRLSFVGDPLETDKDGILKHLIEFSLKNDNSFEVYFYAADTPKDTPKDTSKDSEKCCSCCPCCPPSSR